MEMTSKTILKLKVFFLAIFLGSSTSIYSFLSRYATKKERMISTAKNPLTMLSMMEIGLLGQSKKPNSNGETQAV